MMEHIPAIIIILPLATALMALPLAVVSRHLVRWVSIGAVILASIAAVQGLVRVLTDGPWHYHFGGWNPPWGIEFVLDPLSGFLVSLIGLISFLVLIFAGPYLEDGYWLKNGNFYALYLLVNAGLFGMVLTGDVFNLYVFLEISSLATYGLVAFGGSRALVASFRYLIVGTVAASFYLIGIGYLYAMTGTLNMADLVVRLAPIVSEPAVIIGLVFVMVGLAIKMALFPLHGWQPDAYTYAPPPVTAFISGVMTKVGAYVLFRIFFFVVGETAGPVPVILTVTSWLAAAGIIAGSLMAIAQKDFRRMLAYSSVAQIGYIVLGLSLGNALAMVGALLHVINHAMMKSCLFLVAGGVKWRTGEHTIEKYMQVSKTMPLTMGAFLIAALSMIGIPPAAGFFSKWYLVLGAIDAGMWIYVAVIVLSSLLNAVYFFRVIEFSFIRKAETVDEAENTEIVGKKELPFVMLFPVLVLGVSILVLGIFNNQIVSKILLFALPGGGQ